MVPALHSGHAGFLRERLHLLAALASRDGRAGRLAEMGLPEMWGVNVGNKIGRITTSGVIRESPSKAGTGPIGIAAGPDGNIWFTEIDENAIAEFRLL